MCAGLLDILNVDSPCAKEDVSMDEMFAIKCLGGESTQRVFECPFCGNKIGVADLLKPGTFRSA